MARMTFSHLLPKPLITFDSLFSPSLFVPVFLSKCIKDTFVVLYNEEDTLSLSLSLSVSRVNHERTFFSFPHKPLSFLFLLCIICRESSVLHVSGISRKNHYVMETAIYNMMMSPSLS